MPGTPISITRSAGPAEAALGAAPGSPERLDELADERLVEMLRKGSQAAGDVLVRRYHDPLMRYLSRQSGSAGLAEELLQQTWLSAVDHLDQFKYDAQGGVGFKAWLFRIATNKAHDAWRSRRRERAAYDGLRLVTDDELPDASHRMEAREQDDKLRRAIEQLPEPQKQVVMLRYYSELKFVEIAEMLGCPLNTALGRMHKAMLKLKKLMEN